MQGEEDNDGVGAQALAVSVALPLMLQRPGSGPCPARVPELELHGSRWVYAGLEARLRFRPAIPHLPIRPSLQSPGSVVSTGIEVGWGFQFATKEFHRVFFNPPLDGDSIWAFGGVQ